MGLDLSLIPVDFIAEDGDWGYGHSLLDCRPDTSLFDALLALPGAPVCKNFSTFRSREDDLDSHYGNTQITPYGQLLQTVSVADLLPLQAYIEPGSFYMNRAVWAYLAQMPPTMRVALYWH